NAIRSVADRAADFCLSAPSSECEPYKILLSTFRIKSGEREQTFNEWREQFIWFNADPRASISQRWGMEKKADTRIIENAKNMTVHSSGWALVEPPDSGSSRAGISPFYVKNVLSGEPRSLGPLQNAVMDFQSGLIAGLLIEKNKSTLQIFNSSATLLFSKEISSGNLSWVLPSLLRWDTESSTGFIRMEGEKARDLGTYQRINISSLNRAAQGVADAQGIALLDFSAAEIKRFPIHKNDDVTKYSLYFSHESKDFFMGNESCVPYDACVSKFVVVNKSTGEVIYPETRLSLSGYFSVTPQTLMTENRGTVWKSYLVKWDANWRILEQNFIGNGTSQIIDSRYVSLWEPSLGSVYEYATVFKFENGELNRVSLLPDEDHFRGFYFNYAQIRTRQGLARIRDLNSGKILAEGKNVITFRQPQYDTALLSYDDSLEWWNSDWKGLVETSDPNFMPFLTGNISIQVFGVVPQSRGTAVSIGPKRMLWWDDSRPVTYERTVK
ncbi:MAG: hypothetical protein AABZ55_08830, partial [Bdellovibrionota bacterium]